MAAKDIEQYQFKPGQSGNPKGRPKNRVPDNLVKIFGSKAKAKKFYCLTAAEINEWEAVILRKILPKN